ncbi:hypothetical protein PC128_g15813 [Phytophthora cactorum]|nr:hypothetical protein PC128_g15813 [Phytophthora cactorum]
MNLASAFVYAVSIAMASASLATNAQDGSNISARRRTSPSLGVNATDGNFVAAILTSKEAVTKYVQGIGVMVRRLRLVKGESSIPADIRYGSIGSDSNNGTGDGEQIKVVAILSYPNISENIKYSYDYVVQQLEKPSSFKPISLVALDGSDIKDGEIVTKLGWYNTGGESQDAHELQCADVQLMSNEECSKVTFVDDTRMCSHPVGNQCSCTGDYGGPLIVERPEGDVLVGMVSWGDDCKKPGYPSYYSRIMVGRDWIESVISGQCFH